MYPSSGGFGGGGFSHPGQQPQGEGTLIRNMRFVLDEKLPQNASKFAILLE